MLGIVLSIVLLFIYYGIVALAGASAATDRSLPYVASGLPNIVVGAVGGILIWHEDGDSLAPAGECGVRRALADAGVAAGRGGR